MSRIVDYSSFTQNYGVRGVIYILINEVFKEGIYKIGCTRRSGSQRACDLNIDANTGTPAEFKCIFEHKTLDCGLVEEKVHQALSSFRRGKPGQEFFEVDIDFAKLTIKKIAEKVDETIYREIQKHESVEVNNNLLETEEKLLALKVYMLGNKIRAFKASISQALDIINFAIEQLETKDSFEDSLHLAFFYLLHAWVVQEDNVMVIKDRMIAQKICSDLDSNLYEYVMRLRESSTYQEACHLVETKFYSLTRAQSEFVSQSNLKDLLELYSLNYPYYD